MKKFLMILAVLVLISGCAVVKKQIAQKSILSPASAPEVEKKGGLRIEQGCVADHRDKGEGWIFIEVKCKQKGRFVNIVVNLKPNYQYLVLIGNSLSIRKTTPDGYIVLENQAGENIILIPEMSDEAMKEIKPNPPAALHFGTAASKGGE